MQKSDVFESTKSGLLHARERKPVGLLSRQPYQLLLSRVKQSSRNEDRIVILIGQVTGLLISGFLNVANVIFECAG
jgi:hypothetical protein